MNRFILFCFLISMLLVIIIAASVALLVIGIILSKNHNIGDSTGDIHDYSKSGIIFTRIRDYVDSDCPLDPVDHPLFRINITTYQSSKSQSMDDMIDNADLSNIKWHT